MEEGKLDNKPTCPSCSKLLNGFTDPIADNRPTPGDVTMCLYCGEMAEFDNDMELLPMSEEKIADLDLLSTQKIRKARQWVLDKKNNG